MFEKLSFPTKGSSFFNRNACEPERLSESKLLKQQILGSEGMVFSIISSIVRLHRSYHHHHHHHHCYSYCRGCCCCYSCLLVLRLKHANSKSQISYLEDISDLWLFEICGQQVPCTFRKTVLAAFVGTCPRGNSTGNFVTSKIK